MGGRDIGGCAGSGGKANSKGASPGTGPSLHRHCPSGAGEVPSRDANCCTRPLREAPGRRSRRKKLAGGAAGEGRQHLPGPAAELPSPAPSFSPARPSAHAPAGGLKRERRLLRAVRLGGGAGQRAGHGAVTQPERRSPGLSCGLLRRHVALGPAPRWVPRGAAGPARRARSSAPTHTPCLFAGAFLLPGPVRGSDASGELAAVPLHIPWGFPLGASLPGLARPAGRCRCPPGANGPRGHRRREGHCRGVRPGGHCRGARSVSGNACGRGGKFPDTGCSSHLVTSAPIEGSAGSKSEWECVCVCNKGACMVLDEFEDLWRILDHGIDLKHFELALPLFRPGKQKNMLRMPSRVWQGLPVVPSCVGLHPC